jgi:malonyl-CoA decarboxylase
MRSGRLNLSFFQDLLNSISEQGHRLVFQGRGDTTGHSISELLQALLSQRGEASGIALAREILNRYASFEQAERDEFFLTLLKTFGADHNAIDKAIIDYQELGTDRTAITLNTATEPRRQELLRRLNGAPNATAMLVDMRADLLKAMRKNRSLEPVDHDFHHLLASWFNRGFLVLRRIDWSTSASVLEKIIQYEAVHAIQSWDDLRRRIEPTDRRCYAFFHPALMDEPLIFVEVALTNETPGAIAPILESQRSPLAESRATTATFYSISNCQSGLRGISFGSFLIKQVAEDLKRDLPGLKNFVTLSPVPGFRSWLTNEHGQQESTFVPDKSLSAMLESEQWWRQDSADNVKPVLLNLAARYFLEARTPRGEPVDPVARFHLGNGARLEHIHFLADCSEPGIAQSYGLMVNYLYDLKNIELNHEAFISRGEVVASNEVEKLARRKSKKTVEKE